VSYRPNFTIIKKYGMTNNGLGKLKQIKIKAFVCNLPLNQNLDSPYAVQPPINIPKKTEDIAITKLLLMYPKKFLGPNNL
jgi:hypothetical protein